MFVFSPSPSQDSPCMCSRRHPQPERRPVFMVSASLSISHTAMLEFSPSPSVRDLCVCSHPLLERRWEMPHLIKRSAGRCGISLRRRIPDQILGRKKISFIGRCDIFYHISRCISSIFNFLNMWQCCKTSKASRSVDPKVSLGRPSRKPTRSIRSRDSQYL